MKKNEIIGKQFGYLTVLEEDKDYVLKNNLKKKSTYLKCLCSCGKYTSVRIDHLTSGRTVSCGCHIVEIGKNNMNDLTNMRFGKLIALEPTNKRARSSVIWKCICDCGNEVEVSSWNLRNGDTKSCGCLISKGEEEIGQILTANNIPFLKQKTFPDCLSPKNYKLRFDFYVDNKFLVEFNGSQHYECHNFGWDNEENHKKLLLYDKIKKEYCLKKQIPLKIIPYYKLNKITLEDIMGDKFLVKDQIP